MDGSALVLVVLGSVVVGVAGGRVLGEEVVGGAEEVVPELTVPSFPSPQPAGTRATVTTTTTMMTRTAAMASRRPRRLGPEPPWSVVFCRTDGCSPGADAICAPQREQERTSSGISRRHTGQYMPIPPSEPPLTMSAYNLKVVEGAAAVNISP